MNPARPSLSIAYRYPVVCGARSRHEIAIGDSLCGEMLRKQYRLTSSAQIKDVRRRGRSWHNRWFVLLVQANDRPQSRFAFSVNRRMGKAVIRNRLKRVMRECIRRRLSSIPDGWDVLLIARSPAREAQFEQIDNAIADLLARSRLNAEIDARDLYPEDTIDPGQEPNAHEMCAHEACAQETSLHGMHTQ